MIPELPGTGALVRITVPDHEDLPSRVDRCLPPDLWLAAPGFPGDLEPLSAGTPLSLRWTSRRGVCAAPLEMVTQHRDGVPLWQVRSIGSLEIVQRRRYARAPAEGPAVVSPAAPTVSKTVSTILSGQLAEISEAGVRCVVRTVGGLIPDQPVHLRMGLDDTIVSVDGEVTRVDRNGESCEVIITFQADSRSAAFLRRMVLQQQVRERKESRASRPT